MTEELKNIATKLRIYSIEATNASKSGHPTSCASAAEIMACLFFKVMHYNPKAPRDPNNDRFVLSKGHAAPVLYAAQVENGTVSHDELMNLRKIDCILEGHPTPKIDFIDVATGSLGQGTSCAAGMAYAGKYLDEKPAGADSAYRVYCLIGDGESAEGSVWEALSFAGHYKLNNLTFIFDINRLGQSQPTALQHDIQVYADRVKSFGCHSVILNDGNNVDQVLKALAETSTDKPIAILAKTFKGAGLKNISDVDNWHGKPLAPTNAALCEEILKELKASVGGEDGYKKHTELKPPQPRNNALVDQYKWVGDSAKVVKLSSPPAYKEGDQVATRLAYGNALLKLGQSDKRVVGLDADTKNSTFSIKLHDALPQQFIECFIAEQNMVGVGIGVGCRGRAIPFISTFAAFFTRAFDQIRMGAISQTQCNFAGSHVGVSIGEDGPSQMGLEDLAMFRSVPNCVVFYPSDAVSAEYAVELAANTPSMCYIRTGRPNAAILYKNDETFAVGKAKVLRQSEKDVLTIIAAGVTMTETLKAVELLSKENIAVRIVDPFTIKPLDANTIISSAAATNNKIIVVEDHYPEGGIGEAVLSAVADADKAIRVRRLNVVGVPRSGKPQELLEAFHIDSKSIYDAVKKFL